MEHTFSRPLNQDLPSESSSLALPTGSAGEKNGHRESTDVSEAYLYGSLAHPYAHQRPISEAAEMSVEILDSETIVNFVEDEAAFGAFIRERFAHLDTNHDGLLSYSEMLEELQSLRVTQNDFEIDVKLDPDEVSSVYSALFLQFDRDLNGTVDLDEFKTETKRMMLGMANGMGFLPVQMVLEEGSLLMKAVERETAVMAT